LACDITEAIWINLRLKSKKIVFGVKYCPRDISEHADAATEYLYYLDMCIDAANDLRPNCKIITGDFNAHIKSWGFSDYDNALGRA
jgi:hypothetical protein